MVCDNCGESMNMIFSDHILKRRWCPQCGTIKNEVKRTDGSTQIASDTPELVKRCRRFEPTLPPNTFGAVWVEMGVAEAINPPEVRMKRQ